jgi:hypothetical protein
VIEHVLTHARALLGEAVDLEQARAVQPGTEPDRQRGGGGELPQNAMPRPANRPIRAS